MQSVLARHEMLRYEAIRFGTFFNWNKSFGAWKLVRAGFYYNNRNDEVICFSCGLCLTGWSGGLRPMEEHSNMNPLCLFISGLDKSIPMAASQVDGLSTAQLADRPPADASLLHDELMILTSYKNRVYMDQTVVFPMRITLPEVNVPGSIMDVEAFFSRMSLLVNRRSSFETCAQYLFLNVDKEALVQAGFFCLIFNGGIQCFECRCIICDFVEGDDPLKRHFELAPSCPFIRKRLELSDPSKAKDVGETTCKICLQNRVKLTLVPCGHCFCDVCFKVIEGSQKCGICRTSIRLSHCLYLI